MRQGGRNQRKRAADRSHRGSLEGRGLSGSRRGQRLSAREFQPSRADDYINATMAVVLYEGDGGFSRKSCREKAQKVYGGCAANGQGCWASMCGVDEGSRVGEMKEIGVTKKLN